MRASLGALLQARATAAALERAGAQGGAVLQLTALESLAAWRGVTPLEMAEQLAAMRPQQRDELRLEYAAEHIAAA